VQISATTPNTPAPTPAPTPADTPQGAPAAAPAPAAETPAVTVTLSPEARAAQTALAAMPMADAVKTLTPGAQGPGKLAQAKSLLLKLADGSGVPKTEQVQAYIDLHKLVLLDPDRTWFTQSTPEDRKAYAAIMSGGAISNEIEQAANDFNHWSMSQDMRSNVPRKNLAHLNAMSPLEQQMVFAGTVGWDMASLDQWKAQMQVDIVNVDKMIAMDEAEKKGKSGKAATQAKDQAKAAEDGTAATDEASPEAQALAALTSPDRGDGVAAAALTMLRKAAEARAEAKAEAERIREDVARTDGVPRPILEPYAIGDKVDKAI
jgi:hypothetical protein